MIQLISFAISVIILFFGHVLAWFILSNWFFANFLSSLISALVLTIFFVSILLASYFIHKHDSLVTRLYYLLAGAWTGILINFLLSFVLVFIFKLLFPAWFLGNLLLPISVIVLTSILSTYGFHNAFALKIKEYEVKIKDLSSYWHNKEIVHISDIHIGPIYRKKFFSKIIKEVNKLEPEAVFITGDLFDGMESDFSWLNHPFTNFKIKKGIYYSFGNHDLYLGFNRVKQLLADSPVIILDNKMMVVEGLQLIGINYSFNKDFDLYKAILNQVGYDKRKPSILLYHEPKNISLAVRAGIDLQLSGHTHRGQIFPFNLITRLVYRGHNYGLFNESDFSLIINSGLGTWGPPMRTIGQGEIVKIKLLPL